MNYSGQGAAALAEMSPFGRPASGPNHNGPSNQGRGPMGSHNGRTVVSGDLSKWQEPTYPLVGFDAGTFLTTNKIAVSLAAAALIGGIAYYYGYR